MAVSTTIFEPKSRFGRFSRPCGLLFAILVSFGVPGKAATSDTEEPPWQLRKDRDGIKVYSRPVRGSNYHAFKGIVELQASQASSLALLNDTDACASWLHRCKSSAVLNQTSQFEKYVYQVTRLPFPAVSRDAIFRATVLQLNDKIIEVKLLSEPEYIGHTDYVRIIDANGSYYLENLDSGMLRFTWVQYVDPAGVLPAFMVNSLLTDIPFNSLKNFRSLVRKEKYRSVTFIYDEFGTPVGLNQP